LEREFGADLLFMDVDSIPLGRNFVKVLGEKVAQCDVLLAVIGPNWLTLCDEQGNRRLDGANDFVRVEIASALQRDIPVIPVLLDGARIPKAEQLPPDLKELSLRNSLDVRHASFHSDMDKLIKGLKESSAPDPALSAGAPVQSIAQTTASANVRPAESERQPGKDAVATDAGVSQRAQIEAKERVQPGGSKLVKHMVFGGFVAAVGAIGVWLIIERPSPVADRPFAVTTAEPILVTPPPPKTATLTPSAPPPPKAATPAPVSVAPPIPPAASANDVNTTNVLGSANTLVQFGLIGTWATDCTQPASSSNYLAIYAINRSGEVSQTYYDKPGHAYNNYKITSATRQAPDMLLYEQVWDFAGSPANMAGDRVQILLNMAHNKFQIVSSQGSDGSFFVKDRKFPGSGDASPWQSKCQEK
jgi:hypothetical protein